MPQLRAASAPARSNKTVLEKYLRHVELFRGDVTFQIDDPKPSKYLPGFSEVLVHLVFNNIEKDELFYVSSDGQTIVRGDIFNLGKSPFQSNLDKLNLMDQPELRAGRRAGDDRRVRRFRMPGLQDGSADLAARSSATPSMEKFGCFSRIIHWNRYIPGRGRRPSTAAASISRAMTAFWKFYDWIYQNQDEIIAATI